MTSNTAVQTIEAAVAPAPTNPPVIDSSLQVQPAPLSLENLSLVRDGRQVPLSRFVCARFGSLLQRCRCCGPAFDVLDTDAPSGKRFKSAPELAASRVAAPPEVCRHGFVDTHCHLEEVLQVVQRHANVPSLNKFTSDLTVEEIRHWTTLGWIKVVEPSSSSSWNAGQWVDPLNSDTKTFDSSSESTKASGVTVSGVNGTKDPSSGSTYRGGKPVSGGDEIGDSSNGATSRWGESVGDSSGGWTKPCRESDGGNDSTWVPSGGSKKRWRESDSEDNTKSVSSIGSTKQLGESVSGDDAAGDSSSGSTKRCAEPANGDNVSNGWTKRWWEADGGEKGTCDPSGGANKRGQEPSSENTTKFDSSNGSTQQCGETVSDDDAPADSSSGLTERCAEPANGENALSGLAQQCGEPVGEENQTLDSSEKRWLRPVSKDNPIWNMKWWDLDTNQQEAALSLGWTPDTWHRFKWPLPKGVPWLELPSTTRDALDVLGETPESWKKWSENFQKQSQENGWHKRYRYKTNLGGNQKVVISSNDLRHWSSLTDAEKAGAISLGFSEGTWNQTEMADLDAAVEAFFGGPLFEGCVTQGCDLDSIDFAVQLCLAHPRVYASFGCHPKGAYTYNGALEERLLKCFETCGSKAIAWGEFGLDYSHPSFGKLGSNRRLQREVFARQLKVAVERGYPLVIHSRGADRDTLRMMRQWVPTDWRVHIHSYRGSIALMEALVREFQYAYIGFSGIITMADQDAHTLVKHCPLDRILIETDAPYLPLQDSFFSHPGQIPRIAASIAKLKNVPLAEVMETTRAAARDMYGF